MKKTLKVLALVCFVLMVFSAVALAEELPQDTVTERTSWEKNKTADEKYAPKITEKNGVRIQKTPSTTRALDTQAGDVESKTVASWNNYFLNADNRGCTACHTIEDALEMMETYHGIIYMGYNTEQGLQNCFGCHSFYDSKLRDSIHSIHNFSTTFKDTFNGTCESCHYIDRDSEGNVSYKRWDYVKYDILEGYISVSADNLQQSLEYNQTEVTPREKMYWKSEKSNPSTWVTTEEQTNDAIFDSWTIKFTGSLKEEVTYTLNELIEKYGTETRLMKSHCTVNGPGQGMIYQAEIEGIPMRKIVEDLGIDPATTMVNPIGYDGYYYTISYEKMLSEDALLVVGMNGDRIYAGQGYPVAWWCNEMSAGNFTKTLVEVNFSTEGASWDFYGDFSDATTGLQFDKPNIGVLSAYDGQIFEDGGSVHLEGYADAWNEPIVKIEFSLDKGATWTEYEVKDANTTQWVYWKLDLNGLSAGSYLVKFRVTSLMADGTLHTNEAENQITNYTFVVA